MLADEFWFGEDIQGNVYCSYTDKSPNDFWIRTIIKKDKLGHLTVWDCEIISKPEEGEEDA
jgi:hypothetical protein